MRGIDRIEPAQKSLRPTVFAALIAVLTAAGLLFLSSSAQAVPFHPREHSLDVEGLNHACGVAIDSKGDFYASSEGKEVKVYSPSHTLLTSIPDANEPCGLAVTTTGNLYVSEQATGEVVRFKPDAYPFSGTPTYGSAEPIDSSGLAEGISVDPFDNRLYVAEGNRVSVYGAGGVLEVNNEVQTITAANATGGSFKLKFEGAETASLPFNASAAEVQEKLEALPGIGAGNVLVSGSYSVTFTGALAYTDVPQIELLPSLTGNEIQKVTVKATGGTYKLKSPVAGGTGTLHRGTNTITGLSTTYGAFHAGDAIAGAGIPNSATIAAVVDAETLELSADATATGGTTPLTARETTAAIPYDASATTLKERLVALEGIEEADVSVTGGPGDAGGAHPYEVTFEGAFADIDVGQTLGTSSLATEGTLVVTTTRGGLSTGASTATAGWNGHIGEGALSEASGVATFTYDNLSTAVEERYLWVADAAGADHLDLFRGKEPRALTLRRELTGATTPDGSFGLGSAGAYIAEDPGNRSSNGECPPLPATQACTAGHLFVYDAEHKALDEFDASGEYLDQAKNAAFTDAEPTAVAIDRSGGSNDGTIYVTAGAGAGSKALAFGPLMPPSRETLKEPSEGGLSQILKGAGAVATDSHGDIYVVPQGASAIHIYGPNGTPLAEIEDGNIPAQVAVDSTGKVYVLDANGGFEEEAEVTYYEPKLGEYPPKAGTTYTRHEPALVTGEYIRREPYSIAVNPGPGPGKDHLLLAEEGIVYEFGSAAEGSGVLNRELGPCVKGQVVSLAVDGSSGAVYIGTNNNGEGMIYEVIATRSECLARFANSGASNGEFGAPIVAVDQSNRHVIEYDQTHGAREYDAAGAFVAEFGSFTEGVPAGYGVAVDSACALHEPKPLSGQACEEYDPANGTAYVAFDDPSPSHPPYDLNAFGPLDYGAAPPTPEYKLKVTNQGDGSGKVTSSPTGINCDPTCSAKFKEDTEVTLSQAADPGSKFEKWGGACSGTGECKVWLSEAKEVTAEFESTETQKFPLKVTIEGLGSGKVTGSGLECTSNPCEAEFFKNAKVTLTATEAESSKFASWTGCDANPTETQCEVTITGPGTKEVKVEFKVETPLLKVEKKGGGTGKVTSVPVGIDCGSTCTHEYTLNEAVTLEATAGPGSTFSGWAVIGSPGSCPGTGSCLVTMSKAKEVTATFDTLPKAKVKPALVAYDEATLRGEVDPSGLETEYRFEYLSEAEYEANGESFEGVPHTPKVELAPSKGFVAVEAPLTGLDEGTAYRFRLHAMNAIGPAEDEGSFVTLIRRAPQSCPNGVYRFGLSANLPDCRAYELATPAQTGGLEPFAAASGTSRSGAFSNWLTLQRGKGAGEDLAYFTTGTLPGFEGNGIEDGYRAQRGSGDHPAGGWQSALFSPTYAEAAGGFAGITNQNGVASDQLYSAWEVNPEAENSGPQTLDQGAYLRTPGTANPKCNPQPLQSDFELIGCGSLGTDPEALSLYVSAGGAHAIFSSTKHLEEEAAPSPTAAIYDRAAGDPGAEAVSVKPDGTAFGAGEAAAYAGASEDGSAVVFGVGGALYLHRAGKTTEIATAPNTFAGISEDGTRVFYSATAKGEEAAPLLACDTEAGSCAGSEKTHDPIEIAAAGIFTLVSPDGSHAFFGSEEAPTGSEENENGEEAKLGAHNLYAWDGADVRFLARLAAADLKGGGGFAGEANMNLSNWTRAIGRGGQSGRAYAPSRSSADGEALVFQSHARLTEYDNEGKGEIYRYDPGAEEGERLTCVSCSPTGASPSAAALLEDIRGFTKTPVQATTTIANLTEDGQEVFFQSFDRLLPEDANEVEDVYEWKAKGAGEGPEECKRPGGCLSLISSGQGETPSILYAMSADGSDVFFQTKEKLVGMDVSGSPSIYDAREFGGIPEPSPPAPCQGDACQPQDSEPPVLPNPATTGSGEAEEAPSSTPRRHCAKGKHRVKGRCVTRPGKRHAKKHQKANSKRGGKR